jgi:archaellum component FlaF (FlaF/FlaG flagellin family)
MYGIISIINFDVLLEGIFVSKEETGIKNIYKPYLFKGISITNIFPLPFPF